MASMRYLLCGCCASALAPVALAARHGHGPSVMPPARVRHGAGTARRTPQNQACWMCHAARVPVAETAARIKAVGAKHFVLGTDLGQTGNPTPADGRQMFVAALDAAGIGRDQIQTMGREIPAALLMG